jgi:hypothetical protein
MNAASSKAKVRGIGLVPSVTIIRAHLAAHPEQKDLLKEYLTDPEWRTLMFLIKSDYPYALFIGLYKILFYILAGGRLENARKVGKELATTLLTDFSYLLASGIPFQCLQKFITFQASCFSGTAFKISLEATAANSVKIILIPTDEDKKDEKAANALAEQLAGSYEELISRAGGKYIWTVISSIQNNNFEINLSWK